MTLVVVVAVVAGVCTLHSHVAAAHAEKRNSVKAHYFLYRTRTWERRKCRCMFGHWFGNGKEISRYVFGKLR